MRNLLVASVDPENGKIKRRSTAILIYDSRNPAFAPEGETDVLFKNLKKSLKEPNLLKKISWQKLIPILIQSKEYKDLISWLNDKYKITPMFL